MSNKKRLWNDFCKEHRIYDDGVPLFEETDRLVSTFPFGQDGRLLLKRSEDMDALITSQVQKVINDFNNKGSLYDGLIYMMFWKEHHNVIPLYIGKAEKYGKKGGNLSVNLKGESGKFSRWGYNYAYHIGDLSAVVCPGHLDSRKAYKYVKWANKLFKSYPSESPELYQSTYFWISPWSNQWTGVWKDFGPTPLTFLEYLLIGLASEVFTEYVLNAEGVNRK